MFLVEMGYAQNEYSYQKESDEYYDKIREHKNK